MMQGGREEKGSGLIGFDQHASHDAPTANNCHDEDKDVGQRFAKMMPKGGPYGCLARTGRARRASPQPLKRRGLVAAPFAIAVEVVSFT